MKTSDKYLKIVEWSEEDQCYIGQCPALFGGGVHGDNEAEVYKELCEVVEESIVLLTENGHPLPAATAGKNYSGKFLLRCGEDLHKNLAIHAAIKNESLNSYCTKLLQKTVHSDVLHV